MNRLNVVMKINEGPVRNIRYSQYDLPPSYLKVKTNMLPKPLAKLFMIYEIILLIQVKLRRLKNSFL
jgi:hypothetical protein